jgi:Septum formation
MLKGHDGGRMVAPTRVNEGAPQEPAAAGPTQAEAVTEDRAGPTGDLIEIAPAEAALAEPAAAEAAPAEAAAGAAESVAATAKAATPEAGQAETAPAEAETTEAGHAEAGRTETARPEAETAEAAQAEAVPAEAVPAEAELSGAGLPGPDAGQENAGQENKAREESRDVGPLAVVGIIIGVIALVGVAAGVLAMVTHGFKPKTVVSYRPAAVFGLRPGQCINSGSSSLSYTVVSCTSPHDAEVFARFSLPAAAWPGSSAVRQEAGDACASRLGGYLNPRLATIGLTQQYVYPNRDAWDADQRTVVCEVSSGNGQLTGSVRAKG